jgi:microsomal dipeptidase-like Zn-dependent dipeptidase
MLPIRPLCKPCELSSSRYVGQSSDHSNLLLDSSELTRSPVILSHSDARHFNNISRNVPDEVLRKIGSGKGKNDGVVMVNFYPAFLLPRGQKADVKTVADHIEYIASISGKAQWVSYRSVSCP